MKAKGRYTVIYMNGRISGVKKIYARSPANIWRCWWWSCKMSQKTHFWRIPDRVRRRNPVPLRAGFRILKNYLDSGFHRSDDFLRDHHCWPLKDFFSFWPQSQGKYLLILISKWAVSLLLFVISGRKNLCIRIWCSEMEKKERPGVNLGRFVLQTINQESGCTDMRPSRTEGDMNCPPTIYGPKS